MSTIVVVTDTSVLINLLVLDQAALLARLPDYRFVVTEHVCGEITDHYQDQLQRLEAAFAAGVLDEIRVTDLSEVLLFAQLTAIGLGIGECSAIAVAAHRQLALAIDDRRAVKKLKILGFQLTIHSTASIVVLLIRHAVLTIAEADAMKREWEQNHRFRLPFCSFAERLSASP
jgi:predicted nucleic acid-binding protein